MTSELKVLVTRPEPGAAATAAALAALGHHPVLSPCLVIGPSPARLPPPGRCAAVLVASAQALPHLPPDYRGRPLLAVGDATAERARSLGFGQVASASGTAEELAALAMARFRPEDGALLIPCGAGQGLQLARTLRDRRFRVHRRVVYAARPASGLSDAARKALDAGLIDRALFFSRASAESFTTLIRRNAMEPALRNVIAIVISPPVAESLRALPFHEIRTAIAPDQLHMLAMLP
ncbi:MAG TPA: uroporphyrinogen-III synthase [Acetobacteraceae bacterium]|nr:uroporphyrinogen-III synthase [Acetobacteraceae bacterium]